MPAETSVVDEIGYGMSYTIVALVLLHVIAVVCIITDDLVPFIIFRWLTLM